MANNDPIQGFDVSISIMGPNGPELVGEYKEVTITIKNDTEDYLETNERIARILDGVISISGKLKRGWMNTDIISRVYGYSALRRGEKIGESPRFTISCTADNPDKGINGRLRIEQAVINELALSIKGGKGVVDKDLSFKAEGISEA
ncbi:hypothetical protein [Pelosinus sp. IPA-1]|uniref:hypothetical protein n=1 Tax=Pelosinus sp. IPA-1 TaxID=3029569 RepID=UPI00243621FE|nr:hypothetical protein [Pelosinus sp. IPA-1]GMB00219.1 hypothetical protein PIPA1_30180 [Pelosinus sp. IPA-1]